MLFDAGTWLGRSLILRTVDVGHCHQRPHTYLIRTFQHPDSLLPRLRLRCHSINRTFDSSSPHPSQFSFSSTTYTLPPISIFDPLSTIIMPPATRKAGPGPSRRRLHEDSDDEDTGPTELPPQPTIQELSEEQKKRNAELAQVVRRSPHSSQQLDSDMNRRTSVVDVAAMLLLLIETLSTRPI